MVMRTTSIDSGITAPIPHANTGNCRPSVMGHPVPRLPRQRIAMKTRCLNVLSRVSFRSLLILGSLLAATLPAAAQFGGEAGFRKAFQQDYLSRDIELINEYLMLEEWQKPIIEILLEDYQTAYRAGEAGFRNKLVDISGNLAGNGQDAMKTLMAPFEQWEREKSVIANTFEENVRLQLSEDQMARWPALERALRREKLLPDSILSGEGVDLILVTKQVDVPLDTRQLAGAAYDSYELLLDEALVSRDRRAGEAQEDLRNALTSGDSVRGMAGLSIIIDSRIALRNMQDQQIDLLSVSLGEEWGPRFKSAALRAAYPKAYRPRSFMTVFEEVLALASLTEQQRSDVLAVQATFVADMDSLETRLRQLLQKEEPERELATAAAAAARTRGESPQKPADTFRAEAARRDTIQEEAATRLRDILTPEQLEQVPGLLKRSSAGKGDSRSDGKNDRLGGSAPAGGTGAKGSPGRAADRGNGPAREPSGSRGPGGNNPPSAAPGVE